MGWIIYFFIIGWFIGQHDWSDLRSGVPMDCTHAWENNHCYVCGDNR